MKKTISHFLTKGYFVVMIDGYDEITDGETRRKCSKKVIDFMREYSNCVYFITSRISIYESEQFEIVSSDHTLYLSSLSKEQIHSFLNKWQFPKGKSSIELYNRIISTIQIESVVSNPLLLTMITHVYCDSDFQFSNSRVQLYIDCINCLLKKWDYEKTKRKRIVRYDVIDTDTKIKLLSFFAYTIFEKKTQSMKYTELSELFATHYLEASCFHGKASEVVDALVNQSGLLELTDSGIRFRHRSFYEYFVAFYWLENKTYNELRLNNVIDKQNILFFYLVMTSNESDVVRFINNNIEHSSLIKDIIIERKMSDFDALKSVVSRLINKINYEDVMQLQTLGYIASQYPSVTKIIEKNLISNLTDSKDKTVKVNIIIGLMNFSSIEIMETVLNQQLDSIDLKLLVHYSSEKLDDYAILVINFLEHSYEKREFIELLASTYRFNAVYNIYCNGNSIESRFALLGLLYMTGELEVFRWLENAGFCNSVNKHTLKNADTLLKEYEWAGDELNDSEEHNLFLLVYLCKDIIINNKVIAIKSNMIHNRIAFLLSYIISKETNQVSSFLINIEKLSVKSISEFSYHWRKRLNKKTKILDMSENIGTSISDLNLLIFYIFLVIVFGQMIIWIATYARITELFYQGYDISYKVTASFSSITIQPVFNIYICSLLVFFLVYLIINKLFKLIDYNQISRLLTIFCGSCFVFLYMNYIYNLSFRIIVILSILFLSIIEIIKHRNNYPSFKEPQYSSIINFLR